MADDEADQDQPDRKEDPFTAFVAAHHRARVSTPGTKRFNAGEHAWLAGHGADLACDQLKKLADISVDKRVLQFIARQDRREMLQYGELVALSGDLYESPEDLFEERPTWLPWRNRLPEIREIMSKELSWIEARIASLPSTPYPEDNVRMAWSAKSYIELALRNTDHFGWHNVVAYCRHHERALQLAVQAAGQQDETFRRALYTNAFADHFLTDGFAAGHIRVPRAQILPWAERKGFGDKIAGSLSKLLHDQDGHIDVQSLHGVGDESGRSEQDGLFVQNAAGASWYTRCDGQLFTGQEPVTSPRVKHAVDAVAASVLELLVAWKLGRLPRGIYTATELVPFPHPNTPALIQKFPADMPEHQLERLWTNVGWYSKVPWIAGLERTHIRDLFVALPEIMATFRADVARAINQDPRKTRMSPGYLQGFRNIA